MTHFWPQVFHIFSSKTAHGNFVIFFHESSLWSWKKTVSLCSEKWKNIPNLAISALIHWHFDFFSSKILKFCYYFKKSKKLFREKNPLFALMTHLWPLCIILKFLQRRFFSFFSKKNLKCSVSFFSWNMVSIIEVEIFGFLTYHKFSNKLPGRLLIFW